MAARAGHANVADVRDRGLMVALEFADRESLASRPDLAKGLLATALERHLLLLTCGPWSQVVRIVPPLVTTPDDVDMAIQVIGDALDAHRCGTSGTFRRRRRDTCRPCVLWVSADSAGGRTTSPIASSRRQLRL